MFKDKNNPLLDAAKAAMQKGDEHRKAVSTVNEHFGVYGRRALPLAKKAEYDIALKKVLEGEKLESETIVEEKEEQLDEASKGKLQSYVQKAISHQMKLAGNRMSPGVDKEKLEKDIRKRGRNINNAKDKIEGNRGSNRSYQTNPSGKMKPTKIFAKEDNLEEGNHGYSKSAVDKAIKGSKKKISGKEAKAIHSILKGRQKEDEPIKEARDERFAAHDAKMNHDAVAHRSLVSKSIDDAIKREKEKKRTPAQKRALEITRDTVERPRFKGTLDEDFQNIKEEIANNLYKRYEAVNEDEKQAWVDALSEEEFGLLHEFYNPNVKFRQANANPLAAIRNAARSVLGGGRSLNEPAIKSTGDEYRDIVAAGASGVKSLAGAASDVIAGSRNQPNSNLNTPARGVAAGFVPKAPTTSAVAAQVAAEKPVTSTTTSTTPPSTPAATAAAKVISNPSLDDTLKSYTPAERAARDASDNAAEMDAAQARKLKTTGVSAPTAPETSTNAPAQTDAAAAETKAFKPEPSSEPSPRRVPMTPKRSFGFGDQGSGSDSAGAITNRALGAVNEEEIISSRSGLDGWLNKYTPKKKK